MTETVPPQEAPGVAMPEWPAAYEDKWVTIDDKPTQVGFTRTDPETDKSSYYVLDYERGEQLAFVADPDDPRERLVVILSDGGEEVAFESWLEQREAVETGLSWEEALASDSGLDPRVKAGIKVADSYQDTVIVADAIKIVEQIVASESDPKALAKTRRGLLAKYHPDNAVGDSVARARLEETSKLVNHLFDKKSTS